MQTRADSLGALRSWLECQPHLVNCRTDSNFLLRFLRMQKHKVMVMVCLLFMLCYCTRWRLVVWCWRSISL